MSRKLSIVLTGLTALVLMLSACAPAATPAATETAAPAAMETAAPAAETAAPAATETSAPATEAPAAGMLPEVDPSMVTGDIYSAGSSTVYPLSEAVAELFADEGFTGQMKIDSVGTGGGFERFCSTGESDIANASRAIKDSEAENCAKINRTPIEFRVGTDAIAVVVSKENTFLTDVTLEELAAIFASTAVKWSDVNPAWPAEDILRFTPGTDSGTFDFFVEVVVQKPQKIEKLDDAKKLVLEVSNLQTSEDDNVLVQGVEGSPYAIGYFGYAYFKNQEGPLKAISVDGIAPSLETAESGDYVLSRPLFIYSDASIMQAKPQVAAFIYFYLTRVNDEITGIGYFPAPAAELEAALAAWMSAMGMQ